MEKFVKLLCVFSLIAIWVVFLIFVYIIVIKTNNGAWGGWLLVPWMITGNLIEGIKK